ncbi:MAG: DNA polymerase/3'-5' exonuclease PolX [Thermoleophilia bacterium]|nr:DNA polymerase/3'-5' exonuclease PolX [Thermoleophilia bacterium]
MEGLPGNGEVAARLELMGDLLEIEGAVRHRVLAYRRGAARIRATPESVAALAVAGRAVELPDIGATLQDKVAELATTGTIGALDRLCSRVPPGLAEVARLPGLGPRRARALFEQAGVTGLDGLRRALAEGRLAGVEGIGPKTVAALEAELAARDAAPADALAPLGRALPAAERVAAALAAATGARVEVAGSLRRGADRVKDVDLAAASDDPEAVHRALAGLGLVDEVLTEGPEKTAVRTHDGLRVELRTAPPDRFGNLLQHLTGSRAHNVRLRELARRQGRSVSEHGIVDAEGRTATSPDEAGVYRELGLEWIPPELREDRGEIEQARDGRLPRLVEVGDLRGDLHTHSTWSDGTATIAEMAAAAAARGYDYLGVSDHSRSLAMAGGLDPDRLRRQWEEIARVQEGVSGVRLLRASEVDILADGRLDFDDEVLAALDWVTASVHSAFRQPPERITARLLAAIEHPHVDAIGHPTGRMLGRREGYAFDVDRVLEAAARTGTCLEVNGQPARLDLDAALARRALEAGVRLIVSSDAHSTDALGFVRNGVLVARRAGARAEDVANTRQWPGLRD